MDGIAASNHVNKQEFNLPLDDAHAYERLKYVVRLLYRHAPVVVQPTSAQTMSMLRGRLSGGCSRIVVRLRLC